MKKTVFLWIAAVLLIAQAQAQTFTLKSKNMGGQATNRQVFNGFGCTGENLSPQLYWENAPAETKSFAINMYDPDAPTGSGWWHWVLFDLPASTTELKEGAGDPSKGLLPAGTIQSINDMGQFGFGGPCPPVGDKYHQYIVTIYALKTDKLGLDKTANPALVGFSINHNVIAKSSIVFYYKR